MNACYAIKNIQMKMNAYAILIVAQRTGSFVPCHQIHLSSRSPGEDFLVQAVEGSMPNGISA
jgi:hypothetical protein